MFFNDFDQKDYKVFLEKKPQRIISLVPSQTELLHDLGISNSLVGRTKFCIHPPENRAIPILGGTKRIHRERLVKAQPDLVIGNREENKRPISNG